LLAVDMFTCVGGSLSICMTFECLDVQWANEKVRMTASLST